MEAGGGDKRRRGGRNGGELKVTSKGRDTLVQGNPYLTQRDDHACREARRWKAAAAGGGVEGAIAELKLTSKGEEIEKQLPGGKVKKKAVPEVVLETSTRSKKKCVTTILGARPQPSPGSPGPALCCFASAMRMPGWNVCHYVGCSHLICMLAHACIVLARTA